MWYINLYRWKVSDYLIKFMISGFDETFRTSAEKLCSVLA